MAASSHTSDSAPSARIRRAGLDDAPALAELGASTFVETFGHLYTPSDLRAYLSAAHSADVYRAYLESPREPIWVVDGEDGRLMAYVLAGPCKLPVADMPASAGEIRRLYARAAAQKQRLGTQLLHTALEWLEAQRMLPIYVGVWSENVGAQRLYARHGFRKVGEYDFPVGSHLDREFILLREQP